MPMDPEEFKYLLEEISCSKTVTLTLAQSFDKNELDTIGMHLLRNRSLEKLSIINLKITSSTTSILSVLRNPSLQNLTLAATGIGCGEGAKILGEELKNNVNLKSLYIESDVLGNGIKYLVPGLREKKSLIKLSLRNNNLTLEDAKALAEILKQNNVLEELNVHRNRALGPEGAEVIAKGILNNNILQKLDLSDTGAGPKAAIALAENLGRASNLRELDISYNKIGLKGAQVLAEALKRNPKLEHLFLQHNGLGSEARSLFLETLKLNFTIEVLVLSDSIMSPEDTFVLASIQEATSKNKSAKKAALKIENLAEERGDLPSFSRALPAADHIRLVNRLATEKELKKAEQRSSQQEVEEARKGSAHKEQEMQEPEKRLAQEKAERAAEQKRAEEEKARLEAERRREAQEAAARLAQEAKDRADREAAERVRAAAEEAKLAAEKLRLEEETKRQDEEKQRIANARLQAEQVKQQLAQQAAQVAAQQATAQLATQQTATQQLIAQQQAAAQLLLTQQQAQAAAQQAEEDRKKESEQARLRAEQEAQRLAQEKAEREVRQAEINGEFSRIHVETLEVNKRLQTIADTLTGRIKEHETKEFQELSQLTERVSNLEKQKQQLQKTIENLTRQLQEQREELKALKTSSSEQSSIKLVREPVTFSYQSLEPRPERSRVGYAAAIAIKKQSKNGCFEGCNIL